MTQDERYMWRCLTLAKNAIGWVAPNPMVGAVLVHEHRIIGEGYHERYGEAHAEVNCLASVKEEDLPLIAQSTMYVSLEPCSHYGKTAPCADRIIHEQIPRVVVGMEDPFPAVSGSGIARLRAAGCEVQTGILEQECRDLNKRFIFFHTQQRPYVVLKWAQTGNGKIGTGTFDRLLISGAATQRLVHRWRSEEAAIMVGTRTVALDNPSLTVRFGAGQQPLRLVLDRQLTIPSSANIFDDSAETLLINEVKSDTQHNIRWLKVPPAISIRQLLAVLYESSVQSILIEGGRSLLQQFIDAGCWNEARIIVNQAMIADGGVAAPVLARAKCIRESSLDEDRIYYYEPVTDQFIL